jgi:hypothetical protein
VTTSVWSFTFVKSTNRIQGQRQLRPPKKSRRPLHNSKTDSKPTANSKPRAGETPAYRQTGRR